MNPILSRIIISSIFRKKHKKPVSENQYSKFQLAKGFWELRVTIINWAKDIFLTVAGIGAAAFGLESFLLPSKFIDGGATGMALLATEITSLPLAVLIVIINIPFVLLGYKVIGKQFAGKAAVAICGLALTLALVDFPNVTHDKLLVAVFGGFFIGAGIGLSVRGGAVLDGTEILAIYLSRKFRTTIGDIIIIINIIVFSLAAYLLSVEAALYSMITYLAASRTLDFVIEGIEEYTAVTIISPRHEEIRQMITENLGRGVTVFKGKRGYGSHGSAGEMDIIYTIVTRLEVSSLYSEIEKIDPSAFIVQNSIKDIKGGMIKKRPFKH